MHVSDIVARGLLVCVCAESFYCEVMDDRKRTEPEMEEK